MKILQCRHLKIGQKPRAPRNKNTTKGKINEIRDLLPKNYKILVPSKFKLASPPENGKTFIKNSLIKAKYF